MEMRTVLMMRMTKMTTIRAASFVDNEGNKAKARSWKGSFGMCVRSLVTTI